jgi:hypothetical protein
MKITSTPTVFCGAGNPDYIFINSLFYKHVKMEIDIFLTLCFIKKSQFIGRSNAKKLIGIRDYYCAFELSRATFYNNALKIDLYMYFLNIKLCCPIERRFCFFVSEA